MPRLRLPVATLALIFVLALAGAVAWPSIRRYNERIAANRAHRDAEAIREALIRFYEDNTFFPLWDRTPAGENQQLGRVDLLVGDGAAPTAPPGSEWMSTHVGTLADVLLANTPSYAVRTDPTGVGWAGPYVTRSPAADPWRHRYVVNIGLISVTARNPDEPSPPKYAVWVLSAGPNGTIDTPYKQPIASATLAGDDIGVRVQ